MGSVHAKNQISKSRGMGCRRRTKKQKMAAIFAKLKNFDFFKKLFVYIFNLKLLAKNQIRTFYGFSTIACAIIGKIKKAHNSLKNKISKNKKYSICSVTIRTYMPKIRFLV